jgi:hypothetical protein
VDLGRIDRQLDSWVICFVDVLGNGALRPIGAQLTLSLAKVVMMHAAIGPFDLALPLHAQDAQTVRSESKAPVAGVLGTQRKWAEHGHPDQ